MSDMDITEQTLYDLLVILCDMLSSETIDYHEEILCEFIRTIDLEGTPLQSFIKIAAKHSHLRATLEYTLKNISYPAQQRVLWVMEGAWPDDIETINRLQDMSYMMYLRMEHAPFKPLHITKTPSTITGKGNP